MSQRPIKDRQFLTGVVLVVVCVLVTVWVFSKFIK